MNVLEKFHQRYDGMSLEEAVNDFRDVSKEELKGWKSDLEYYLTNLEHEPEVLQFIQPILDEVKAGAYEKLTRENARRLYFSLFVLSLYSKFWD